MTIWNIAEFKAQKNQLSLAYLLHLRRSGTTEWIRTTDPYHVKVVL